jgi:hypothetical protein
VLDLAIAALPEHARPRPGEVDGPKVLASADSAGSTHLFAAALRQHGIGFSLGFSVDENVQQAILTLPETIWTPAYNADGEPRRGAWVAEITGLLNLSNWPEGSRVIVRRERPHPGAQLTFSDIDGHRFTAFLTDTPHGQLPDLEQRHRSHARVEDRIRTGKDTGLRNLPFYAYTANACWLELALAAADLITWTQALGFTGPLARYLTTATHPTNQPTALRPPKTPAVNDTPEPHERSRLAINLIGNRRFFLNAPSNIVSLI